MHNPYEISTLKFITAGTVDEGKSTLIGRLLFDSKSIMADQVAAIAKQSKNKHQAGIDLALLTDGLRAEREQGITIDVAYRYFTTPQRNFVVIDAPGHFEYTRNMVTGASHADVMILLVDVQNGISEQTRRHAAIAALLNIKHVVVAVNKMDLVNYARERFEAITAAFEEIIIGLGLRQVQYIPISALVGDNVVERSAHCPWYSGMPLLQLLETMELSQGAVSPGARLPVQYVIRSQTAGLQDYRGYAGKISSGVFRKGDPVMVLPSGKQTRISSIAIHGVEAASATKQQSVVLQFEDAIEVGRGDLVAGEGQLPLTSQLFDVLLCWMGGQPLVPGAHFLLQLNARTTRCVVTRIVYKLDIGSLQKQVGAASVALNDIARVTISTASPVAFDPFAQLPASGNAILVEETGFATVAACMIQ